MASSAPESAFIPRGYAENPYVGGCTAYLPADPLRSYPGDSNQGKAQRVVNNFFSPGTTLTATSKLPANITYAVAVVPDPIRTNLSLALDREIALIQQAAQDAEYDYDSAWIPWRKGESRDFNTMLGRQYATTLQEQREACPGVLLFRKRLTPASNPRNAPSSREAAAESYANALAVLVVGEEPTGGINEKQWINAVTWITTVRADASPNKILRVLGPTFSGSLTSLQRALSELSLSSSNSEIIAPFENAVVLSGSVSSCNAIETFQQHLGNDPSTGGAVKFGTFSENDALHIFRLLAYLSDQGAHARDTAILSEDETEYSAPSPAHTQSSGPIVQSPEKAAQRPGDTASGFHCNFPYNQAERPVSLVYPRDISALRDAYHKQSVFETIASKERLTHTVLREETESALAGSEGSDTVPTFSGTMSAVDQEARLFGVVDYMRVHHTRYLILRCTNPLDFLFLTRFFHRAYPEARIVTVGSDLLFRRQIDTTEFRGTLALSSYPLFPESQHWSTITDQPTERLPDNHLVIGGNLMEGNYIAARYLFQPESSLNEIILSNRSTPKDAPITIPRAIAVPDYADPYWLPHKKGLSDHPPTWLTTLGEDGYWPIAALNDELLDYGRRTLSRKIVLRNREIPPPRAPSSTMVRLLPRAGQHYESEHWGSKFTDSWSKPPLSWKVCLSLAIMLLVYQGVGLRRGYARADGIFAVFDQVPNSPTHGGLIALSCALAHMPLIELLLVLWPQRSSLPFFTHTTIVFVFFSLAACCSAIYTAKKLKSYPLPGSKWITPTTIFTVAVACFTCIYIWAAPLFFHSYRSIPFFYRNIHLTNGVSPLLPILLITFGFYLWNWQLLAGNLMLSEGRPLLPLREEVEAKDPRDWRERYRRGLLGLKFTSTSSAWNLISKTRNRLSDELGRRAVISAHPLYLSRNTVVSIALFLISALLAFAPAIARQAVALDWPMLTTEGSAFNLVVNILMLIAFVLVVVETLRLYGTWVELRRLLLALGRSRLRRTLAKLDPIAANSLWSVSSNLHRVQARIFHQQLEAAKRLYRLLPLKASSLEQTIKFGDKVMEESRCSFEGTFLFWRKTWPEEDRSWDTSLPVPNNGGTVAWVQPDRTIRDMLSDSAAQIINEILSPEWEREDTSMYLDTSPDSWPENEGDKKGPPPSNLLLHPDPAIQIAEEFVSCHYIAFIQNIMARMRTVTLSMVFLFVTICFAISFYPFVPRTGIATWMVVNLILIGATVAYVYAGMDRDEILSYITNSRPGRLGPEFWVRFASFMIGPVIGILATQFPSISDYILGWLQPGLNAVK